MERLPILKILLNIEVLEQKILAYREPVGKRKSEHGLSEPISYDGARKVHLAQKSPILKSDFLFFLMLN